jgi:sec-independent protein translocase protein TatC
MGFLRRFLRALRLALLALLPGGAARAREADRRRARRRDPEGRMPVLDHLREMRNRLIRILLIIGLGGVVGFMLYDPILEFLTSPYCDLPYERRFPGVENDDCRLVFTGALEGFTTRLKVSVIAGAVLTAPFWLYQIWAFVTPGLHRHERRYALTFVAFATVLFAAGVALSYVTLHKGLEVLIGTAGENVQALLTAGSYISFVTLMLVVFGAAFQLPLLVVMLNQAGVLPYSALRRSQRVAIFLIFVFTAVATPSGDPFTMLAMALPVCLLFEVSVLIARVHDSRKARREAARREQESLDDAVPSAVDPFPSPLPRESWGSGAGAQGDVT